MIGFDRESSVDVGRSCAQREEEYVFSTLIVTNSDVPLAWMSIPLSLLTTNTGSQIIRNQLFSNHLENPPIWRPLAFG